MYMISQWHIIKLTRGHAPCNVCHVVMFLCSKGKLKQSEKKVPTMLLSPSRDWLTRLMINSWQWQGWVTRGAQVNLSGGLLSYEWWHSDKAECHHFVVGEREIGREMADSFGPAYMIAAMCHAHQAMSLTAGVRVHLSLFSAHCRLLINGWVFRFCECCVWAGRRCSCPRANVRQILKMFLLNMLSHLLKCTN